MAQETTQKPALEQLAENLGEGWRGKAFSSSGDGLLYGPGGEKVYVQLYLGEASLDVQLYGAEKVPAIKQRVTIGESLPCMVEAIRAIYPAWAEAWQRDRQRIAAIPGDQAAFAAEVAEHLGDGWTGGVDGFWSDLKTFVERDGLRVVWKPVMYGPRGSHQMAPRLELHPADLWFPSITVAAGRPAKAVASEIRRRLLPGYHAAMAAADAEDARHAQATQGAADMAAIVRQALGGMADDNPRDTTAEQVTLSLHTRVGGECTVYGDVTCYADTVTARLLLSSMTAPQAKAILGALSKAIARERDKADAAAAGGNE